MRFYSLFCLFLIVIMAGCDNAAQQTKPIVYYDVAGFIKQQIADLSARKPIVRKEIRINNERNQQTSRDLNWIRELELFAQADINKPALRSSYRITRPDSTTYQYTLKKSEERLTVRSLTVQIDSLTRQPRRIEAILQTNNPLYSSERHLVLESGLASNRQWQIQHYRLSGFQQLSYFDKNEFFVEGNVQ